MKHEEVTFDIKCTMNSRWVPHFLAMLKYMEQLGGMGSSRRVAIYADGDGDFHPEFEWDEKLDSSAKPTIEQDGHRVYDAG